MRRRPRWRKSSAPSRLQEERRPHAAGDPQPPPAAHGESRGYEGLAVSPVPLDYASVPQTEIIEHARQPGTRRSNSATQRFPQRPDHGGAPTGTIGLVMDCDTTGIEPDFAR